MLQLKMDCPYCQHPMRVELANLSPEGCHYLIPPYNEPGPRNHELYYFRCGNGHAHVTIAAHEYYFQQFTNHDEFTEACQAYEGPLAKGYKPFGMNSFDGTVRFLYLSLGLQLNEHLYASFHAEPGQQPLIYVTDWERPYDDQVTIECPFEWLALSPDQIIDEMKKVLWWGAY